jgi:hypothetical protein
MFRLECPFKVTVTCLKESRSNFASKIDGEMEEKAELKKKKKKTLAPTMNYVEPITQFSP